MHAELTRLRAPLRDLSVLLSGNVVRLGLGLLASALVYRGLGPSEAGRLAIALGLVSLFSFLAEFGFRDSVVNYVASAASPEEAEAVARSFLLAKLVFGTLAAIALAGLAGWIVGVWYRGMVEPGLVRLAALILLTGGLLNYVQTLLEARKRFAALSLITVAQGAVRAGAIVILFATGHVAVWPLIGLEVGLPLVLLIYGQRFLPPELRPRLARAMASQLGRLWRFSRWIAVASAAATIYLSLDVVLLGHFRTAAEVGLYGAALALVAKFEVVQTAIFASAFPEACRYRSPHDLRAYVSRTLRLTGLVSVAMLLILPFAGIALPALYGGNYVGAVAPFSILLLSLVVGLNAAPVSFVLYPLERPSWVAAGNVLQLVFFMGLGLWLIPTRGAVGAALTALATQLLGAVWIAGAVTWVLREPRRVLGAP